MSPPTDDNSRRDTPAEHEPERGSSSGDQPTWVTGPEPASGQRSAAVPLGPSIEGYVLKEEIHRGGQGIVYRAVQLGTKRQVALKVLLEGQFAGETTRRRFEREIELAASLRHPNIVTILDSGLSRGRYYFAMEYIDGIRLDRYLAQKRPGREQTLRLFESICDAVNFAHQRGVIHRDLKPSNILVDGEGQPRVLDFGLAKPVYQMAASDSTVRVLSTSGQLIGTVAYMSPEQAAGAQDVDVRSDVYSLGVIFYDALVGHPPYPVEGPLGEVLSRIATDDPVNPRHVPGRPDLGLKVNDELATILLKTLEKERERRYQTAGDLGRDVGHLRRGEPIEAKRASGLYMFKKTLRRYRVQATMAGLMLVLLLAFLVTLAVLLAREREERLRADQKSEEARLAVISKEDALGEARERTAEANLAQQGLRRALVRQHIQRGDAALDSHDLREARDNYWKAFDVNPSPAAIWALRRYYLQTSDSGAALLAFGSRGPSVLSPDGQSAAVSAGPDSILVIPLTRQGESRWVRTPGPVTHLDLRDDGALAAAGPGWARGWKPGMLRPGIAIELPPAASDLRTLHAVAGGEELFLVTPLEARLTGADGDQSRTIRLRGRLTGPSDYAAQFRLLAVPTTAGVELVSILWDGVPRSELVWSGPVPPRAVRFDDNGVLGVLADGVYTANMLDPNRQWTRVSDAASEWELFDLKSSIGVIAHGTRAGDLGVFRSDDLLEAWRYAFDRERGMDLPLRPPSLLAEESLGTWRFAVERLEALRVSLRRQSVLTLDDRGTITSWTPPKRKEQRRRLFNQPPLTWTASADGSVVLMASQRGQVTAYATAGDSRPRTLLRPRLLTLGGSMSLAVSGDGRRAAIRDRSTVRLMDLAEGLSYTLPWSDPVLNEPSSVALSETGELVAMLARSSTRDRQRIVLGRWPGDGDDPRGGALDELTPHDLVGADVRDLAFQPQTNALLVARSNGQLLLLRHPEGPAPPSGPRGSAQSWMQLEVPAREITFNRTGEYLAAACDDDVIRLIFVARREVRHRIPISQPLGALTFNPRDDVLLARGVDGTVSLFDPATGELMTTWALPDRAARPMAAWSGDNDAMLLGHDGGVYEYRYAAADAIIERNRAYSHELRVAERLADAQFEAAWRAAVELRRLDPSRGRRAQLGVLEAVLRRPNAPLAPDWPDAALDEPEAATCARLGHAAYDGSRFVLARRWLRRCHELTGGVVDAFTGWRLAECDYLADSYDQAVAGLASALSQADTDPSQAPIIALERVLALVMAGRMEEARQAAPRVGEADARGRHGDIVTTTYASVIARVITGMERGSAVATVVDSLLGNVGMRPLLLQDDEHFFAGELARRRGALDEAAVHYQRCIDLARDVWPSNWARHRLTQLAAQARPTTGRAPAKSAAPDLRVRRFGPTETDALDSEVQRYSLLTDYPAQPTQGAGRGIRIGSSEEHA